MAQQRMKIHTEYDYSRLEELQRVLGRALAHRRRTRQRAANVILGLAALVVAAILLALQKQPIFVVILVCMGLYFLVWGIFFYQFAALATLRALKPSQTECDCILERTYMLVTNGDVNDGQQYRYEDCRCLLETERNYYFILKDGQGVVLDKAHLKGGTVEQLRTWMEEKSGQATRWMGKQSAPYGEQKGSTV